MKKVFGVILVLLLAVSFLTACGENRPAEFTLSGVTISPSTATVNDTVTISATVTNVGEVTGGCDVKLAINGYSDSKWIDLASGGNTTVSFSYAATTVGSYTATVSTPDATASKSFTVRSGEDNVTVVLPVWYVGDSWVYDCSYENPEGTLKQGDVELTVTVTGEESVGEEEGITEASYHLNGTFVPEAARDSTTAGMTLALHIDQADIFNSIANIQFMKQCSAIKELPGLPACIMWAYTPALSWPPEGTWNFTKHTVAGGGMVDETVNRQGKVLGLESITVPAGTFSCYHIVEYDPASPDTYTYEHWFNTTEVKSDVKMIDRDTWDGAETRELSSYSVS
jgi:predicted small lipoprotein YifL